MIVTETKIPKMKRDLEKLKTKEFDLLIIGGGIFAGCAAWDADLRGLSVARIEKEDFASGSSANSFKFIHGGIRYLQHGDVIRLRASCRERSAMLRIAPHLVQPMPVLIPTYGYGKSGKFFLGAGMLLYDFLTLGRNRNIRDSKRRIPLTRFFSRKQVLDEYSDLEQEGLTGGAMFSDAQMYNPTRLVLSFILSAESRGACIANYMAAEDLIIDEDVVKGVKARDALKNEILDIRAKSVLNAAGPWSDWFLKGALKEKEHAENTYSRDACFIVKRRYNSQYALAVQGRTKDPDALLSRPARHLFMVPWRDYTLVGVWHRVWKEHPDKVTVKVDEIKTFIDEINWACPDLNLTENDGLMWNAGLVPFWENQDGGENLSYGKRSLFIDHQQTHKVKNLVTLIGIRYTTARGDVVKAVDLICDKIRKKAPRADTENIPLVGGDIEDFDKLVNQLYGGQHKNLSMDVITALAHNYGTEATSILALIETEKELAEVFGISKVTKAEVKHAINSEMVFTLADIVFRRTDLATAGNPGIEVLKECANFMAKFMHWDSAEVDQQVNTVLSRFPDWKSGNKSENS